MQIKEMLARVMFAGTAIVLPAMLAPMAYADASAPTAKVQGGVIVGTREDDMNVFKGIPFAAPPVGENRWREPQPLIPWSGVKKADAYGPAPMQNRMVAIMFSNNPTVNVSEDCLYLNVWAPANRKGEKLPVMVWIFGGGFNMGLTCSSAYDGAKLAKHGVVVVSIAYRVGPFGFLAHPELSSQSGHVSGNYGLLDQIAGLRWVKRNIAQFGGNPANVTIFGESAGGQSTSILAVSPLAHGLFQKVICESGSYLGPVKLKEQDSVGFYTQATAEKQGADFLGRLGANSIAAARALSADAIQDATSTMGLFPFGPVLDCYVMSDNLYRLYLAGRFNDTPVLIGTNSDDGGMFAPAITNSTQFEELVRTGFGEKSADILAAYPHATDAQAAQSTRYLARDIAFAWGTWSWARLQTQHGKGAAYLYYFDRHSPMAPNGAGHASELGYIFGVSSALSSLTTPDDIAVSNKMQLYWTNFAKTSNPNGPGLVNWPSFHEPDAKALKFDNDISVHPVPNLSQLKALDSYFTWRCTTDPSPLKLKR